MGFGQPGRPSTNARDEGKSRCRPIPTSSRRSSPSIASTPPWWRGAASPWQSCRTSSPGAFPAIAAALAAQDVTPGGPAFALYPEPPGATADLEVGFPTGQPVQADGEVRPGALPGGRMARLVHAGPYEGLPAAWGRLAEWMQQAGATPGRALWEAYLTDPSPGMDPADLRTELNWTIAG